MKWWDSFNKQRQTCLLYAPRSRFALMLRFLCWSAAATALSLVMAACSSQIAPSPSAQPSQSAPTSTVPVDQRVTAAFAEPDPEARRTSVLSAVQAFLAQPSIQTISDADATHTLNDLAFA